jgi:hypothetical protein
MISVLDLNIPLENLLDVLRKRPEFRISGFKFLFSENELQRMNVNI